TGDLGLGPGGAVLDPLREVRDLFGVEPGLGRHLDVAGLLYGLKQKARFRMARNHRRSSAAALHEAVAIVDAQSPLGIGIGRVAVEAVVNEKRPNLALEKGEGRLI